MTETVSCPSCGRTIPELERLCRTTTPDSLTSIVGEIGGTGEVEGR